MDNIKNLKINLESKILKSDKVIIVPHNGIDFDAIGSSIGISEISTKLGKESYIVLGEPEYKMDYGAKILFDEAKNNYFIINKDRYMQVRDKDDLYIFSDVNKSNLVSLDKSILNKENVIIIDHHKEDENTIKSNYKYINPSVSSTCEIVTKLLLLFKVKITPEVANYLLAGIHLDTSRLSKNTSPETFKIISKLMEYGATTEKINEWFIEDFNSDRRVHNLISMVKMFTYKYAMVVSPEDEEYTREELAKAADYLLKYGVDASFAVGNIGDDIISISARSGEKVNVGDIMKEMGGGGNRYSAATKIKNSSVEEVRKQLIKTIQPKYYNK